MCLVLEWLTLFLTCLRAASESVRMRVGCPCGTLREARRLRRNMASSFGHGEIFSFHAREGDGIGLFAGGPDNASAVVIEDEARRRASIIGISCAGGIDIAMERSEREILEICE